MLSLLIISIVVIAVVLSTINPQLTCYLTNGHTLYRTYSRDRKGHIVRVYQHCLCGYETKGWILNDSTTVQQPEEAPDPWWSWRNLTRYRT